VGVVLVSADPQAVGPAARELAAARVLGMPLDVLALSDVVRALAPPAAPPEDRVATRIPPEPPEDRVATSIPPEPPEERVATSIPPVRVPPPAATGDAWTLLGLLRDASIADIERAADERLAWWTEAARTERRLDARAQASTMVARIRAARLEALGATRGRDR
jgi:hypothetical protein